MSTINQLNRFSFEAVDVRTVAAAFISFLQINAIISGEPLYLIASIRCCLVQSRCMGCVKVQLCCCSLLRIIYYFTNRAFCGAFIPNSIGFYERNGGLSAAVDNLANFNNAIQQGLRAVALNQLLQC